MRRICVFTATRAEFGLLRPVMQRIADSQRATLQVLASGTHLSEHHGLTIDEIREAGFSIDCEVDIDLEDNSMVGICRSMGRALEGYGESLRQLSPDLAVVLGDRYEALCLAAAAQICHVPLAHIHGGERSEGAIDEAFRHCITKMSHLHFTSCEAYRRRVIQLGESPDRVFCVGALGVENALSIAPMSAEELGESVGFAFDRPFFLVTFHPVTLEAGAAEANMESLFEALKAFSSHQVLFTRSNADTEGDTINRMIDQAVAQTDNWAVVPSLGARRYLSAVRLADVVVGNSSSGILEVPSVNVPTVNIGDRQKGRVRAESVIDCDCTRSAIIAAIEQALSADFRNKLDEVVSPYEQPETSARIVETLESVELSARILKKPFFDIPFDDLEQGCN
jgi:UDP-hydrolysing UDP-N-acetyl-D-glucosamine 2-epimerase